MIHVFPDLVESYPTLLSRYQDSLAEGLLSPKTL